MSRLVVKLFLLLAVAQAWSHNIFTQQTDFWQTVDKEFEKLDRAMDSTFGTSDWQEPLQIHSSIEGNVYKLTMSMPGIIRRDIMVKKYANIVVIDALHAESGNPRSQIFYHHTQSLPNRYNQLGRWTYSENGTFQIWFYATYPDPQIDVRRDQDHVVKTPYRRPQDHQFDTTQTRQGPQYGTSQTRPQGTQYPQQSSFGSYPGAQTWREISTAPSVHGASTHEQRQFTASPEYGHHLPDSSIFTKPSQTGNRLPVEKPSVPLYSGQDLPTSTARITYDSRRFPIGVRTMKPISSQPQPGQDQRSEHVQGSGPYGGADVSGIHGQPGWQEPEILTQSPNHESTYPDQVEQSQSGPQTLPDTSFRSQSDRRTSGSELVNGDPNTRRVWNETRSSSQSQYNLDQNGNVIPAAGGGDDLITSIDGLRVTENRRHYDYQSITNSVDGGPSVFPSGAYAGGYRPTGVHPVKSAEIQSTGSQQTRQPGTQYPPQPSYSSYPDSRQIPIGVRSPQSQPGRDQPSEHVQGSEPYSGADVSGTRREPGWQQPEIITNSIRLNSTYPSRVEQSQPGPQILPDRSYGSHSDGRISGSELEARTSSQSQVKRGEVASRDISQSRATYENPGARKIY